MLLLVGTKLVYVSHALRTYTPTWKIHARFDQGLSLIVGWLNVACSSLRLWFPLRYGTKVRPQCVSVAWRMMQGVVTRGSGRLRTCSSSGGNTNVIQQTAPLYTDAIIDASVFQSDAEFWMIPKSRGRSQ
jgi:hypothetical protein